MQSIFQAFLDGTLSDDDAQLLGAHLESCGRCNQAFDRFEQSNALLQGFFGDVNRARVTDGLWEGLNDRLTGHKATQTVLVCAKPRPSNRWRWRTWAPIGGVVALIVLGLFWHATHQPELYREQQELEQIRQSILRMEAEMERPAQG